MLSRHLLAVAVVISLVGILLAGLYPSASEADDSDRRRAAKIELDLLVEKWSVSLDAQQWQLVTAECADVQTTILRSAQQQSGNLWLDYEAAIGRTGGLIWSLTDRLAETNDDASYLNMAMVALKQKRDSLKSTWDQYDQSLGLSLAINCAAWPNQFVAGLRQVIDDQAGLKAEIGSLTNIIEIRIPLAIEATSCRLATEGAADCPKPDFDRPGHEIGGDD